MAGQQTSDTIAAIATPPGTGGIGIIRISGSAALPILQRLFKPHKPHHSFTSHSLCYGTLNSRDGSMLDEVLAVYMRGPNTYTREDVVEIQSHVSLLVLNSILTEVIHSGARVADPGEFTKRAFLAGRIELTQAEAVIDLLQAQTDRGVELAVGQLQGEMYVRIEKVRKVLDTPKESSRDRLRLHPHLNIFTLLDKFHSRKSNSIIPSSTYSHFQEGTFLYAG